MNVLADVDCEWEGLTPIYRVYVNDEMFAERTWIWTNVILQENLPIYGEPGDYHLRWELVEPNLAKLKVINIRVDQGPGQILDNRTLRIG